MCTLTLFAVLQASSSPSYWQLWSQDASQFVDHLLPLSCPKIGNYILPESEKLKLDQFYSTQMKLPCTFYLSNKLSSVVLVVSPNLKIPFCAQECSGHTDWNHKWNSPTRNIVCVLSHTAKHNLQVVHFFKYYANNYGREKIRVEHLSTQHAVTAVPSVSSKCWFL